MKHLGDITKIRGDEIEPVDCIVGGSPCQDLSVAGKCAGLSGARSGLFMEQIRIVKEMRKKHGKPKYMVWENVPGAFSSNGGEDFRAILEETIRIANESAVVVPRPPRGGLDKRRMRHGRRIFGRLATPQRSILGSPPEPPPNRACRRFWRRIRTRNTF